MRRNATPGFRRRQQPHVWNALNQVVALLIALCLGALLFLLFLPEWNKLELMKRQRDELIRQKQTAELEQKQLEREVTLIKTDPEYVEMIARDKLDLMKEGETIYRLDSPRRQPVPATDP